MARINIDGMRHRAKNKPSLVVEQNLFKAGGYFNDPPADIANGSRVVQLDRSSMYDVVIPQFFKRSQAGEIFNNAMYRIDQTQDCPFLQINAKWVGRYNDGKPTTLQGDWANHLPDFALAEDLSIKERAITQAYSNVNANEGNTVLWLGEAKETVKMLGDIGTAIKNLHAATKKARIAWMKGKLSVEGQQKLTLALLFGILPLEQQIADFMEGLFRTKDHGGRYTARGFRVASDSTSKEEALTREIDGSGSPRFYEVVTWNETIEIVARAGVLYEIDLSKTPFLAMILDPKSVVSTAYALARLSFVIDWFINVGSTLAAWSPSMGVNERSAWITLEVTRVMAGTTHLSLTHAGETDYSKGNQSLTVSGGTSFKKTRYEKWRVPINRSDLAIFPRLDLNLDLSKIASLVLLFAKIK